MSNLYIIELIHLLKQRKNNVDTFSNTYAMKITEIEKNKTIS